MSCGQTCAVRTLLEWEGCVEQWPGVHLPDGGQGHRDCPQGRYDEA